MFPFDQKLFNFIHNLAGQSRVLDFLGIFLSDYLGYFLAAVALYLIFSRKNVMARYHYFLFTALTLIISRGLLTEIIRYFFPQSRPFVVLSFNPLISPDFSVGFPSGHAAFYFALAFSIFAISRRWGWILFAGALLMGVARVFTGVHWPSDIAGGIVVAFISFLISYFVLKPIIPIGPGSSQADKTP